MRPRNSRSPSTTNSAPPPWMQFPSGSSSVGLTRAGRPPRPRRGRPVATTEWFGEHAGAILATGGQDELQALGAETAGGVPGAATAVNFEAGRRTTTPTSSWPLYSGHHPARALRPARRRSPPPSPSRSEYVGLRRSRGTSSPARSGRRRRQGGRWPTALVDGGRGARWRRRLAAEHPEFAGASGSGGHALRGHRTSTGPRTPADGSSRRSASSCLRWPGRGHRRAEFGGDLSAERVGAPSTSTPSSGSTCRGRGERDELGGALCTTRLAGAPRGAGRVSTSTAPAQALGRGHVVRHRAQPALPPRRTSCRCSPPLSTEIRRRRFHRRTSSRPARHRHQARTAGRRDQRRPPPAQRQLSSSSPSRWSTSSA